MNNKFFANNSKKEEPRQSHLTNTYVFGERNIKAMIT
jgi:hypothetical protein